MLVESVLCSACSAPPALSPTPKQVRLNDQFIPEDALDIRISDVLRQQYSGVLDEIRREFRGTGSPRFPVYCEVVASDRIPKIFGNAFRHPEAYRLEIRRDAIRILGSDPPGVLHGLTTLEKIVKAGRGRLPLGDIVDWPDHKIRALHIVVRKAAPKDMRNLIRSARMQHFNTLILQLADGVALTSMERLSRQDAWSLEQFVSLVRYARENGLTVIPEVKLLTHQEKLLKDSQPQLMFNRSTYDPRLPATFQAILPILDEIISLIHPPAIHIGHDELSGEPPLPPDLFLRDVKRLRDYLYQRDVRTWMWGDMLLGSKEFPGMRGNALHGNPGYAALRDRIPKDIVICDWHYVDKGKDFPSARAFVAAGHEVLGATWKEPDTIKNFSRYVAKMPHGGLGMIATTWFHVQHGEWGTVEEILRTSGEYFWNVQ